MKNINYIDLGARQGEEIDIVLKDYISFKDEYSLKIYGVEADSYWVSQLEFKYKEGEKVEIYNIAISDRNEVVNLYLESKRLGSSIFSSKRNVTSNSIEIQGMTISNFIQTYIPDYTTSINVMKLNIEGAELLVYRDLIKNDMLRYIHVFCGHPSHDILKVPELSEYTDEYFKIIKENNIDIKYLCGEVDPYKSINIFNEI